MFLKVINVNAQHLSVKIIVPPAPSLSARSRMRQRTLKTTKKIVSCVLRRNNWARRRDIKRSRSVMGG